jgi:predicted esterase
MALNDVKSEILKIKSFDGYMLKGKLTLPKNDGNISKLVIHINGAGPNTYHIDFFPEYYANNGIAYFSYNKRGVYEDENPSSIKEINENEYKTYLPSSSVEDIFCIINILKNTERFNDSIVLINGWSEGTIIAPLFVMKYPNIVKAIFLMGYSNVNLKEMQIQQCSKIDGGNKMLENCFNAVEQKDNKWLMNNMGVTSEWLSEHYELTSNNDILPKLDMPVFIFHGESDGYCDVKDVYEIKDTFLKLGKTNLSVNIFEEHGHGLEIIDKPNEISLGRKMLLEAAKNIY